MSSKTLKYAYKSVKGEIISFILFTRLSKVLCKALNSFADCMVLIPIDLTAPTAASSVRECNFSLFFRFVISQDKLFLFAKNF